MTIELRSLNASMPASAEMAPAKPVRYRPEPTKSDSDAEKMFQTIKAPSAPQAMSVMAAAFDVCWRSR